MTNDHQPDPTPGAPDPFAAPDSAVAPPADPWRGQTEVLESSGPAVPAQADPRTRGSRRGLAAVAGVGVAAVIAAGGAYAYALVAGGGDQPEDHLPSTAVAVLKVDLNPSASQKMDAVRFFEKFPEARKQLDIKGGDLRKSLYEGLTKSNKSAPPWNEVEGWLGDRIAVAAVADPAKASNAIPVLSLAVTDEDKARTSLAKLAGAPGSKSGFVVADGWAIVSDTQPHAQTVADAVAARPLSQDPGFRGDVDALGEAGIARIWYDGRRIKPMLGDLEKLAGSRSGAPGMVGLGKQLDKTLEAHGAMTLRFTNGTLELAGRNEGGDTLPAISGSSGIAELPESSLMAFGAAGMGAAMTQQWSVLMERVQQNGLGRAEFDEQLAAIERETGLKLPKDLAPLLGQRLAFGMGKPGADEVPTVGARVWSDSPDLAEVLAKVDDVLADSDAEGSVVRKDAPGGYVIASTEQQATELAAGGKLGSDPRFTAAVPDAGAAFAAFVDVAGLVSAYGKDLPPESRPWLDPVASVGMSAGWTGPNTSQFALRITTK